VKHVLPFCSSHKPLESQATPKLLSPFYARPVPARDGCPVFTWQARCPLARNWRFSDADRQRVESTTSRRPSICTLHISGYRVNGSSGHAYPVGHSFSDT
jgi:hypothetical protein